MLSRYGRYTKRYTYGQCGSQRAPETRLGVYRPRVPRNRYRTDTPVVKLTQEATWTVGSRASSTVSFNWNAFQFTPGAVPGFKDYQTNFSHFRILSAKLTMSTYDPQGSSDTEALNYLVVGSRPFAATTNHVMTDTPASEYVPAQPETSLREARWQKVHYPSKIANKVTMTFHPYTMVAANGPVVSPATSALWQRIWEGRAWAPMTWTQLMPIVYYGPYIVVSRQNGTDPDPNASSTTFPGYGTLELYLQFKGQK